MMTITPIEALTVGLEESAISAEARSRVEAVIANLIRARTAHQAYHQAQNEADKVRQSQTEMDQSAVIRAALAPHGFGQTWLARVRDIASELVALADGPTDEAARSAAAIYGKAFPGLASAQSPFIVDYAFEEQVYYSVGPARYPVRIDDVAAQDLEAVVRTLVGGLPKGEPVRVAD